MKIFFNNCINWFTHCFLKYRWKDLQSRNINFFIKCFGMETSFNKRDRAIHFGEEAIELLQASGLRKEEIIQLVEYVYRKKPDNLENEFADAQVTLLALASSHGVYIDDITEQNLRWAEKNTKLIQTRCKKLNLFIVN